jgi:arylsulfatase A-like enzyme
LYDRDSLALADNPFAPKGAPGQSLHQWNELRNGYGGMPQEGPVSDELARTLIHGYYACVSYTDKLIGDLLDELERLEMDEETIVILIGDHGWQLGEHALWCKHALYETSLHTPMIIKAPGFTAGQRSKALVEFVDLYPTICELAGLEPPYHLQGKSLVNVMKNPKVAHKPAIFARYHGGETVRTARFQYSEWPGGEKMFYDHQLDPDENLNRANNPDYAQMVERLKELLAEHRRRL